MNFQKIRKIMLIVLFGTIIIYSLFQAEKLIRGPIIKIYNPINGETYNQTLIEVQGNAKNVAYLYLNGNPIYTDKAGNFKEKFLLSPGYNVIKIDGYDKFKKYTQKTLEIILKEY